MIKQPVIYPKWWLYSLYTLYTHLYIIPYNGIFYMIIYPKQPFGPWLFMAQLETCFPFNLSWLHSPSPQKLLHLGGEATPTQGSDGQPLSQGKGLSQWLRGKTNEKKHMNFGFVGGKRLTANFGHSGIFGIGIFLTYLYYKNHKHQPSMDQSIYMQHHEPWHGI